MGACIGASYSLFKSVTFLNWFHLALKKMFLEFGLVYLGYFSIVLLFLLLNKALVLDLILGNDLAVLNRGHGGDSSLSLGLKALLLSLCLELLLLLCLVSLSLGLLFLFVSDAFLLLLVQFSLMFSLSFSFLCFMC